MPSISNIYATGYQANGHANSHLLLNGGERSHFIKGSENYNDCGSMMFLISRGGTSAASIITKAYLTYDEKVDSHVIFNGVVRGCNKWELFRVNSYSASGQVFTINNETKIASDNDEGFNTNGPNNIFEPGIGENTWITRSNQAFSLYSNQSINTDYLKVKWTCIEQQDVNLSEMTVYIKNLKLHIEFDEKYYAKFYNNGTLEKTLTVNSGSAAGYYTPIRTGYKFLGWRCSADNKLYNSGSLPTGTKYDITYTAEWELGTYTLNFKNTDGSTISSKTLTYNTNIGDLPTVTRNGYSFVGWVPCAPAKKMDGQILDSREYFGDKNSSQALSQSYKYSNNLSIHIEALMDNWMSIKDPSQQIISCTESGGWGLGYQANTAVNGAESHGFEVHTGSGYTGYDLKFGTSGAYTNNRWYSFDITFSNGVIEIFIDGVSKGTRTASGSSIKYNASNTIFVGAEAGGDATTPAEKYFKGLISNVFIANDSSRLAYATTTTKVPGKNTDYYPVWRINRYTVTFNANGGTTSVVNKAITFNSPYGELPVPTRTGYTFNGWYKAVSGGTLVNSSTVFTRYENQTLYAQWTPITYTIFFDGNSHEFGTMDTQSTVYDATAINLLKNAFKKIGYNFNSWNTKADGTGIKYTDQQLVRNVTTTTAITLYAQWEFVGDLNYNNLFSFSDWGTSSSGAIDGEYAKTTNFNINFKDGSINIKDISSPSPYDAYTRYGPDSNFYHISVNPDTEYFFNFTITQNYSSNDQGQFFVFYYTLDKDTNKLKQSTITSHRGWRPINITGNYSGEFKTPLDCVAIGLRFGIYSSLADITFSNILICEKTKYDNIISKIPNYKIRDYLPEITFIQELPSLNTGYLFDGWRAENNKLASTLTLNRVQSSISSITAYSFERPITYTIHFNKNCQEGTGIIASQIFTYDELKKLTKNVFQRYRYQFVKWKTILNEQEVFFNDEEEILNLFSNQGDEITLYAQWEYVPIENTIKLDDNIFASKVLFDNIPVIEILIDNIIFFREHL